MLFVSFLSGCASTMVNQEELNKVKKVAVVGFTAYQPVAAKVSFDLGSGKLGADKYGSVIPETSKETDLMLAEINKALNSVKGWKTMDPNAMKKNPVYMESWKSTMTGWQNKMPPPQGVKTYGITDIMDKDGVRLLKPEGKVKLINALGVDAVIIVESNTMLDSTTIMGIGQRKPFTQFHIEVFSANSDAPIWFATFKSDISTESVGATHFIDEEKVPALALATLKNALSKMKSE